VEIYLSSGDVPLIVFEDKVKNNAQKTQNSSKERLILLVNNRVPL